MVLTAGERAVVRARNALICLDPGPAKDAARPDEAVAELDWDGEHVQVQSVDRHRVWLEDPLGQRTMPLRPGEWVELPFSRMGWWTVRFGSADRAHRFVRFRVEGVAA
jgi:hypothetical protein